MSNHTGRLVLAPREPHCAPDRAVLIRALAAAGLLGSPLTPAGDAYAVGDAFLHLVAFTGCAVQMEVDPRPESGRTFCHIRFVGPFEEPVILTGRNTRPPRCPVCRYPLRDWRDVLPCSTSIAKQADPLPCPACATLSPACAWDWKESGGCARLALFVEEVFPGEATPTDALMRVLAEVTQTSWRHFFIQD